MPDTPDDPMLHAIGAYFGKSEPGAAMSHLLLLVAQGTTGLGLPDLRNASGRVVAIAPVSNLGEVPEDFLASAVVGAVTDARRSGLVAGAVLTVEQHYARLGKGERPAQGKLHLHPGAAEVTAMYAACADGRRWHGKHTLTGPDAGTISGPHLLTDLRRPADDTQALWRLVRAAVGLRW